MVTRILLSCVVVASALVFSGGAVAADSAASSDAVIDAFVAACEKNKDLDDAKRKQILDLVTRERSDESSLSSAITGALRILHPEFQQALVALGDEQLDTAITKLGELAKSDNRFLADDAKYFLARAHMNSENYEAALPLLTKLTDPSGGAMTLHSGEAMFMQGVCQTNLLDRKKAIASLKRFLAENPNAAERLRIGAEYQIAELELVTDGSLLDVQSRMDFSRRRLALEDSGEDTQDQQAKIVSLLDTLIAQAEKKEKKGSGECEKCGKPKGSKPGQCPGGGKCPGSGPGGGTGTPGGGGAEGAEGGGNDVAALRRTFGNTRSAWAKMRKQDYEKVLSALKAKYPGGRYSKLADEYRRTLQEEER